MVFLGVALFVGAPSAPAATVSFTFNAVVTSVNPIVSSVEIGDAIYGTFDYDNQAPPISDLGASVFYEPAVDGVVSVGSAAVWAFSDYRALAQNEIAFDAWAFSNFSEATGETLDGIPVRQFLMSLVDTTASVYDDTVLPPSLNLADFDLRSIQINATTTTLINAQVTSLTAVPVPAALPLLVPALIGLITIRRRQ